MKRWIGLSFFIAMFSCAASAHEMRPAYLELRQLSVERYEAFWKVPARSDDTRLALYVQLPEGATNGPESRAFFVNGAYTERWSFKIAGGLAGKTIRITGLEATLTDVLVRIERLDRSTQVTRLTSSVPFFVVEATPKSSEVARTYLVLGFEHILTGADHLMFVSGLLMLVTGFWRVVKTVSAFTVSHSVTLTLATLGFVHVPSPPVEAIIALSILFVAYEVLNREKHADSLAQRKPWLVAFSFGLLHGLGFAGGLSETGLPQGHIPTALGFFSAGVELGHFAFVTVALGVITIVRRSNIVRAPWAWRLPPYAIGGAAAYWLIARISTF